MNWDVNKYQLILATFYLSSNIIQTLQFCFGSYSDHYDGRMLLQVSIKIEEKILLQLTQLLRM